ncbi:MAG: tetratricopeptide repeat protein, partial [Bacteroidota bacterium]
MAQVDSLLRQIDGLDNLKTANAYINLSDYYLGKNSDSLFYYGLKAYDASKLIANDTIQERAILNMGSGMFYIQNYDSALHYYNQIIENETVGDNYIFAKALSNKGIIFYYQGDYANALVYFLKSAEFREENDLDVSIIYSQLAVIYQQTEDYDKAKKAYKKSYQESLVNKEMNSSLSNLASLFVKLKEYDSALFYSQKSLKYYRKNNADSKESHALGLIGYALLKLNNYERALSYFDSAIVLSQKINLPQRIAEQYSYSAQALIALGEYYPALEKLDSARIWSDNPLILRDIAQYKSEVYTLIGKIQPSFNSYKEYIAIRDSLNRVEKYEQVAELEKKYETQKKEQKI